MSPVARSDSMSLKQAFAINAPEYAIGLLALGISALALLFMILHGRTKNSKPEVQDTELDVVGNTEVF
jgi:hypothetical protein